jgi:hypothetical protein
MSGKTGRGQPGAQRRHCGGGGSAGIGGELPEEEDAGDGDPGRRADLLGGGQDPGSRTGIRSPDTSQDDAGQRGKDEPGADPSHDQRWAQPVAVQPRAG